MSGRAERYRQCAAEYAAKALAARVEHRDMFRDLATAWRDLAEREEAFGQALRRQGLREEG